MQIGERVAGGLEGQRRKRLPGCRDRVDAGRMVDKVGVKTCFLDLRRSKVARELVDNCADHFHVRQLLGAYRSNGNVPIYQI